MPPPADLRPALRKAAGFLLQSRNAASGLWEDFASTAGPSTEWVTGFVLASLASLAHPDLRAAREKLLDCQRQDGSWGFCSRVPGDADSTAWAVLGLGSALPDDRRDGAARFLLAQQLGDRGGFRTYPGTAAAGLGPWAPGGRDHSGWQAAHTCVTGTVVLALAELGQAGARAGQAARYLADRQDPSGVWPSYWWSGVAYSTHQALRALRGHGLLTTAAASRAAGELACRQLPSGGWAWDGSLTGTGGAFETAFALLALDEARQAGAEPGAGHVLRGLAWLTRRQSGAGRWRSQAILRVPMPSDRTERLGACEAPARPGGLGPDPRGVFTAAVAARCLGSYQDWSPQPAPRRSAAPASGQRADIPPVLRFLVVHEAQTAFAATMASRGLTITPAARVAVVAADRTSGRRIAARLPAPAPGSRVFGQHWRDQAVPVLGFGWGMTHVLAAHQSLPCQAEAAELGAVLILGTAAVDQLLDGSRRRRDALLAVLNRDLLAAAAERDTGQRALAEASLTAADPGVRYVLALVSAFFQRLQHCSLAEDWYQRICDLLRQAYDAELRTISARPPEPPGDGILQAHLSARVLPLQVISAIQCGLRGHACAESGHDKCTRAAQLLGEVIAAVDDLADLCADARTGAVNSLLAQSAGPGLAAEQRSPSRALIGVLSSGACWHAVDSAARALTELGHGLPPRREPRQPSSRHRALAHLSGWGDLGSHEFGPWQAHQHRAAALPGHRAI